MSRLTVLATSALIAAALPLGSATAREARDVQVLADGWRFAKGDVPSAEATTFDDSQWQAVKVPHTWNRVGYYLNEAGQGRNTKASVDKYQGVGWYRLAFQAPAHAPSRHWLEFDAASRAAKVWLNGVYLGEHRGGFARFRLDVSQALRPGQRNVLSVRVDNTAPAAGGANPDILPLTGDFFVHGGLYRPVRLISTPDVHLAMDDFGGTGIKAETLDLDGTTAHLRIAAQLRNDRTSAAKLQLRVKLIGRDGRVAAMQQSAVTLAAGADGSVVQQVAVRNPHLWAGVADPYLYRLVVEVVDARSTVIDRVEQSFGIRTVSFDPQRGFMLNKQPYRLHGVGYHQDVEGKGWAISPQDVERDVAIMREMGVNSIRLTHYQHGQVIHDLADRYGFILWDEIPLVSQWTVSGALDASPELVKNARQQLVELIRQNYNHPSVAIWSIANEVDFGNSLPAFLTGRTDGKVPDPLPLLHQLQALAKTEDPHRATALATCCEGRLFDTSVTVPEVAQVADLGGANRYFGWYFGQPGDFGPHLDQLHAKRPQQPLSVTEYGAGGATSIHTDNVLGAAPDSRGRAQPEEYQSYIHEQAWAALKARPYLFASWLWNSFDFATTIRAEGDAQDINTKGLVTYDRGIRKDAWYFYKANWTATPTVHINGRRYVNRHYPVTDVRVYSNAPSTTLFLNGRKIGTQSACQDAVCEWKGVALDAGANALSAVGAFASGKTAQDAVTWQLAPECRDRFAIDAGALVAGQAPGCTFGSDSFFTGGEARTIDKPADYGKRAEPAAIKDTDARDVMATYRSGAFSYVIPAAPGQHRVTLSFLSGQRPKGGTFDVVINGRGVLQGFDPAAGAPDVRAISKSFDVTAIHGITIEFRPVSGDAMVSAIAVERGKG